MLKMMAMSWLQDRYYYYYTPIGQTYILGWIFCNVFTAYTTIQFYSVSIYGPTLASKSVSTIYLVFTIACLVSPTIVNKAGETPSMTVGITCYAVLVTCSLVYFWYGDGDGDDGNDKSSWPSQLVVLGGAILGFGAALLWTSQGRLILAYAAIAEQTQEQEPPHRQQQQELPIDYYDDTNHQTSRHNSGDIPRRRSRTATSTSTITSNKPMRGTLVGIFWAIFQCSSLIGGTISFLYYNNNENTTNNDREEQQQPPLRQGSTTLYLIFLGFIVLGAIVSSKVLLSPTALTRHISIQQRNAATNGTSSTCNDAGHEMIPLVKVHTPNSSSTLSNTTTTTTSNKLVDDVDIHAVDTGTTTATKAEPSSTSSTRSSWWYFNNNSSGGWFDDEASKTLRFFTTTKRMWVLSIFFFYSGYNQPYQQATYGNRFFTKRTIGIELIVFHLFEIIGAIYGGRILDGNDSGAAAAPGVEKSRHEHEADVLSSPSRRDRDEYSTLAPSSSTTTLQPATSNTQRKETTKRTTALTCLVGFAIVNAVGNLVAYIQEHKVLQFDLKDNNGSGVDHSNQNHSYDVYDDFRQVCWLSIPFV